MAEGAGTGIRGRKPARSTSTYSPRLSIAALVLSRCAAQRLDDVGSNPTPAAMVRDSLVEEQSILILTLYIKRRGSGKIAALALAEQASLRQGTY